MYRKQGVTLLVVVLAFSGLAAKAQAAKYESAKATVDGVEIHYLKAGTGKKVLLTVHGFGETSKMWIPLFDEFGTDYTIIAPDLPGLGDSSHPASGYDKKTAAVKIHDLVKSLGYQQVFVVGHDIGLMVVYAYAAQFPSEVEKLALLEAPIPGIGDIWPQIYTNPALWHFHFVFSPIALDLVKGRERTFLEHFWQSLSANQKAISEAVKADYARSYAKPGSMRSAFEYFKAFDSTDAADNRKFVEHKLTMPVLVIAGDKAMGTALEVQARLAATDVTAILLSDTGHWLMSERPTETKATLKQFLSR
jgi:pimeloyl-ACP methyl ester carboxylesterase